MRGEGRAVGEALTEGAENPPAPGIQPKGSLLVKGWLCHGEIQGRVLVPSFETRIYSQLSTVSLHDFAVTHPLNSSMS